MVAVSRVSDYWHHWQDVFAGGLLGMHQIQFSFSDPPSTVTLMIPEEHAAI
jgi:hypothetical protein